MEKIKIEDLKRDLYIGDLGEEIANYNDGYICDVITEIADNNIDIYFNDLFDWAKGNISYIEEALDEFGTPQYNGKVDFMKIIQQGQYCMFKQDLYNCLEDIIKFFVFDYIEKQLEIIEITEEQLEELESEIDFEDNNEQLENIIDKINEILNVEN